MRTALARWATGLVAVLAVASPAAGAHAQAPGAESTGSESVAIKVLEAPASLRDDPRARAYIIDHLPPGRRIDRAVEVTNTGTEPVRVKLYAGPANVSAANGFSISEAGASNELSSWTTVEPGALELAPGEAARPIVDITVPADALEGERYAVVWAQIEPKPTDQGIATSARVGVRVYLDVGEGNGPAPRFDITGLRAQRSENGAPQVVAEVQNTGKRALDPTGTIRLHGGPGGLSTDPVTGAGLTIAPDATGTVVFEFDPATPAGPWTADLSLTGGTDPLRRSTSLTFPDTGSTVLSAGPAGTSGPPWASIGIGAAALAGLVVLFGAVRSARRRSARAPHS